MITNSHHDSQDIKAVCSGQHMKSDNMSIDLKHETGKKTALASYYGRVVTELLFDDWTQELCYETY